VTAKFAGCSDHIGIIVPTSPSIARRALKAREASSTIIRTTLLLFYDKLLQYVTKFATMTSGQRNKSVVHPEQRYAYVPCPLHDTGELSLVLSTFRFLIFSRLLFMSLEVVAGTLGFY